MRRFESFIIISIEIFHPYICYEFYYLFLYDCWDLISILMSIIIVVFVKAMNSNIAYVTQ